MPFRICRIVISGRQPHAQEPSVSKNAATKLMQPQVSSRRLHVDHAGSRAGRSAFSLLDFVHQENVFLEYNGGAPYALALLSFIAIARRLIREIIASEARHKMHQV